MFKSTWLLICAHESAMHGSNIIALLMALTIRAADLKLLITVMCECSSILSMVSSIPQVIVDQHDCMGGGRATVHAYSAVSPTVLSSHLVCTVGMLCLGRCQMMVGFTGEER